MPAIGHVTRQEDGSYTGQLATLTIRKNIQFVPNKKERDHQPYFIVMAGDVEVGAAWNKVGQASGKDYVSISLAAPEFGDRTIYANLGRKASSDNDAEFALIWNPSS